MSSVVSQRFEDEGRNSLTVRLMVKGAGKEREWFVRAEHRGANDKKGQTGVLASGLTSEPEAMAEYDRQLDRATEKGWQRASGRRRKLMDIPEPATRPLGKGAKSPGDEPLTANGLKSGAQTLPPARAISRRFGVGR